MHPSGLLVALLVAAAPAGAAAPPPAPGAAAVAPAADLHEKKPVGAETDNELLEAAERFHEALLRKDFEALSELCRAPFYFEGSLAPTAEEIKRRWGLELSGKALSQRRLGKIELLSPEQMVRRFGRMPERLAAWPRGTGTFSVADLEGHPVVVLWRKLGAAWYATAIHD